MAVPFLPPTKLQLRILDHFVEEQGYGSGVHKLYRRLKVLFDGLIHPAMDDEGNVAYTKGGDVWEEVNTPKNVKDHSYILDGKKYTYETREVVTISISVLIFLILAIVGDSVESLET